MMKIKASIQQSEVRSQNKRKSEHHWREYNRHRLFILTSDYLSSDFLCPPFSLKPTASIHFRRARLTLAWHVRRYA